MTDLIPAARQVGEESFVKRFAATINTTRQSLPNSYVPDAPSGPFFSLEVPLVAVEKKAQSAPEAVSKIEIKVKSIKPSFTLDITVLPTLTVHDLKKQLVKVSDNISSVEAQRLLYKGKALKDGAVLREYDLKGGETLSLMLKPTASSEAAAPTAEEAEPALLAPSQKPEFWHDVAHAVQKHLPFDEQVSSVKALLRHFGLPEEKSDEFIKKK